MECSHDLRQMLEVQDTDITDPVQLCLLRRRIGFCSLVSVEIGVVPPLRQYHQLSPLTFDAEGRVWRVVTIR